MVLVDTSVWIDHLRRNSPTLAELLDEAVVLTHPFVLGELACGNMKNRGAVLSNLKLLPVAVSATHEETVRLIEDHRLWGRGIGWVDAHLLASALLTNSALWTLDDRLNQAAEAAGVRRYGSA
ncbi:MAG: PIN domain-containing protein [Bryobacteraceae bacterium]|jgi:predicted nucleic acid-binding protein